MRCLYLLKIEDSEVITENRRWHKSSLIFLVISLLKVSDSIMSGLPQAPIGEAVLPHHISAQRATARPNRSQRRQRAREQRGGHFRPRGRGGLPAHLPGERPAKLPASLVLVAPRVHRLGPRQPVRLKPTLQVLRDLS